MENVPIALEKTTYTPYGLTPEQRMIQETAREFAQKEIAPHAKDWDQRGYFSRETILKLGELGFLGMLVPEEYGGSGLDTLSYLLALEEICKVDPSIGVTMSVHNSLPTHLILKYGTEDQKRRFLVPLAQGKKIGAFALSEANAGSDAASIECRAVRQGDRYILNGTKAWVTNGATADFMLLFAKTNPHMKTRGVTAFILEQGTPGLSVGREEKKMGLRASNTVQLALEQVEVPADQCLGEENMGFIYAMRALDGGRMGIAAQALGIAQACLELSVSYAKERRQFSQPIASFQAVQFMLAELAAEIEAARVLLYETARRKDAGLKITKEAAMAKLLASSVAMKAGVKAIQIYGGYGYMEDYPVERYFRDAKVTEIYEGTSEIQKIVIARQLLG